ncbi:MAG: hypothetical protein HYV07_22915 [Deltaproteobacteria bacterium]|nr:hypothetical protein [Deltaproteobacteria bacterium]
MLIAILAAATLHLHLTESSGLDEVSATAILKIAAAELKARAGAAVIVGPCPSCAEEEVLELRLLAAPRKIRAHLLRGLEESQIDFPRSFTEELAAAAIRQAIAQLFPVDFVLTEPVLKHEINWGPWIAMGASAALGVTGIVMGLGANDSREELTRAGPREVGTAYSDASQSATIANILFASAGAAMVGALLWLAAD